MNNLKVKAHVDVSNDELERKVNAALQRDPFLESRELSVQAVNGKIYLYGLVDTGFEKNHASEAVSKVPGVILVDNNIRVASPVRVKEDWALLNDVKSELFWSPFVDENAVNVEVDDGEVTLTGSVSSWFERRKATENAREAGAVGVVNKLKVLNDLATPGGRYSGRFFPNP